MKTLSTCLLLFTLSPLFCQGVHPEDWGLQAFQIHDPELGEIHYYVTADGLEEDKPLLFMVSGTRGLPVMLVVQSGEQSIQLGTFPPDQITSFSKEFHVAFIGKVGTPFSDTLKVAEINPMQNLEDYPPSEEYIQHCGMDWEIEASKLALDALVKMLPNSSRKVIALGISEGGQLVPRLVNEYDRITHLVGVVTTGLNQFYSSIINRRMDAAAGIKTHQEAQNEIDSLFAIYRSIYSDPESTRKWYYGHPYKRWGSYCSDIPLDHLVKLDIPILYLKGTADRNSPVLQSDYIMLEFIRLGKTNFTYKVYPGADHWFSEVVESDGERKRISHRAEAFSAISDWIDKN